MKSRMMVVGLLAVFLSIALGISALAEDCDNCKYGGTLVLAKSFEPINMSTMKSDYCDMIHAMMSEPPILRDPWGHYVKAGWLESYDVSLDELVWTFQIKEGVTFHDGEPLNAEALAWTMLERKARGWRGRHLRFIPEENFKILDEYTLQLQATAPNPNLLFMLTTPCLYGGMETPNSLERYGEDYGLQMAYGNGPFKLEEWVRNDHMTFARNEDYNWAPGFANNDGPAFLESIKFVFVPESATRVEMLRTGEVDGVVDVPFERLEELQNLEGVNILSTPGTAAYFAALNVTKPPLDELKVRQALSYAIDRELIAEKIFYGYASPAYSLYLGAKDEMSTTKLMYHYNVAKAKALLEEAGWVDSNGDGIREKDGDELAFSLWTSNKSEFRRIGEVLQAFWREIGADVNLERFDEATLRAKVTNNEHQATIWQHLWAGLDETMWETNPDNKWYPNQSGFEPPQEMLDAQINAATWEEWLATNDALCNYVQEQAPILRLVRPDSIMAVRDNFKDIRVREGWWAWLPYFYDVYDADLCK